MAGVSFTCLAMIMKGSLIVLTSLCGVNVAAPFSQAGVSRAVCPNPTVEAVEGENVLLPCHLDPPNNVVNYTVDWKRVDLNKVVYSYRHKRENPQAQVDQYRGRTAVNHDGLTTGNLALRLSSVQLSDTGPYRCFVSKLMTGCSTFLTVVNKDQQNSTAGNVSFTTLTPPDVRHKPDGENWTPVIIAVPVVLVVAIALIVVLMWKRRTLQKCVTGFRGRRERTGETANGAELQRLETRQPTEDQDGPAANGLQNHTHVVL